VFNYLVANNKIKTIILEWHILHIHSRIIDFRKARAINIDYMVKTCYSAYAQDVAFQRLLEALAKSGIHIIPAVDPG